MHEVLRAAGRPQQVPWWSSTPPPSRVASPRSSASSPARTSTGRWWRPCAGLGFNRVFDTSFTADLTIMEEGSELVQRVTEGRRAAHDHQLLAGLDQVRGAVLPGTSPQRLHLQEPAADDGRPDQELLRPAREGLDPRDIVSVVVMPCTAKKFECNREEMGRDYVPDVDYVLTTRELAELFRVVGINLGVPGARGRRHARSASAPAPASCSAPRGGVMEAAVRSRLLPAHRRGDEGLQDPGPARHEGLQGAAGPGRAGWKWARPWSPAWARRASSWKSSRPAARTCTSSRVMTCPGGCINGGGQPIGADMDIGQGAHGGPLHHRPGGPPAGQPQEPARSQRLYEEFLGKPLGHKSHELLHTHYHHREVMQ